MDYYHLKIVAKTCYYEKGTFNWDIKIVMISMFHMLILVDD